ncbi:MAG: glycerate kinase [Betaproteobacteria bacterium HGW-Betaproteobacteria-14]|nr:MAG: glycerate kinase [Betaproteobacteria bacterium HGW-Betaproteobacteria-14]
MTIAPKELLAHLFAHAVRAADPAACVPRHLPQPPGGRTLVVGAGKAAAAMARAVEDNWPGGLSGLVVTRYGHGVPCERIEVVEAAHPVPDAAGQDAAARMLAVVQGLTSDDLVLVLISGGGSALLALPWEGVTLADKQQLNRALLKSGAGIGEMNCVRKHLSAIKGGRLAVAAYPARVVTLVISDVPGDDPAVVASGPTLADPTTCEDALAILDKYRIEAPHQVRAVLQSGVSETPKPGDLRFSHCETRVIATARGSLAAAAEAAREAGIAPLILGDAIEGEAREVAKAMAGIALSCAQHGEPARPPCVLLSGGETTVTVKGKGRGGRNAEFLLALALALDGHPGIHAIACDTDGIDGSEDNAGALLQPDTLARAAALGVDARAHLADNDGYGFFAALDDLVVTGPTRTNVNDFRAVLVLPAAVDRPVPRK